MLLSGPVVWQINVVVVIVVVVVVVVVVVIILKVIYQVNSGRQIKP